MKRLMAVLLIAIIALCLVACDEGEQSQTTVHNTQSNSNPSGSSSANTTGTHTDLQIDNSTTHSVDGSFSEETTSVESPSATDGNNGESTVSATTADGNRTTTSPILTTTKRGETTTTSKTGSGGTSSTTKKPTTTTTTSKKTTTTTTKKTTTTTTKKTTTSKAVTNPTDPSTKHYPKEMFNLVNAERKKHGLPAYTYYSEAQDGADIRAQEILQKLSHTRPDGTKWWTVDDIDDKCQSGAENIAKGCYSVQDMLDAFMNSESHRVNILSTQYTHMVVGYYDGAWVQIFIKPR